MSESTTVSGYMHPAYAESFAEFARPRELERSKGWLLERQIPGFPFHDAMGCYPLFSCQDWSRLGRDLDELGDDLVTVSLVADPFGSVSISDLQRCFDLVTPFKEHYVTDLRQPFDAIVSSHHQRYSRRSLRDLEIEQCSKPLDFLDEWVHLYAGLIERHGISGIRSFSKTAFQKQLSVPGLVMFRAAYQRTTVGLHLWFQQGDVAYGHLGATNAVGYKFAASYGLYWFALEWFSQRVSWLHLGGAAGVNEGNADGLSEFKRGWATGTRMAYFCGRCFDRPRYDQIVKSKTLPPTNYFPAYRFGE